jgi:hypothetical protein
MKKQAKKLVLAKETVRSLTRVELREIVGGTVTVQCWSDPEYSCQPDFNPYTLTSAC